MPDWLVWRLSHDAAEARRKRSTQRVIDSRATRS